MGHWHMEPSDRGRLIASRYAVLRPLGRGGMASTLLVRDELLGRELALKLLELEGAGALELFRDEFARLSGTYHPRLLEVVDFGSERRDQTTAHFYTAVHVAGTTLDRFAIARPWRELERALCDVLHALGFLHALGIRHGDVKPQNIIVSAEGRATLIDLGCAARLDGRGPRAISGTPAYMAPELLADGSADGRADLYAVGVVIAELGRRMSEELPLSVRRLTARLTANASAARPAEAAEVLELLGDPEPVRAVPQGRAPALVGRRGEMALFEASLQALAERRAGKRVLWLHGPSGIGKSRLLAEMKWAAQLRSRVVVGLARAPEAAVGLLRRACAVDELPAGVAAVLEAHDRLAAGEQRLVLVLDDADALERGEREVLDALIRSIQPTDPLLLVCAAREPCGVPSDVLEPIRVAPLDPGELVAWAGAWVPQARIELLHARTGGIPARIEATLADLAAGRLLETELGDQGGETARGERGDRLAGGGPTASRTAARAADPDAARVLARLDDDERRALGLCVVLGPALGRSPEVGEIAPATLAALCAKGLLRREATGWRLGSAVDAEALGAALEPALLSELHRGVAGTLLRGLPAQPTQASSERAARAVAHLVAAGWWEQAEALLLDAATGAELAAPAWSRAAASLVDHAGHDRTLTRLAHLHQLGERPLLGLQVLARLVRRSPAERFDPVVCYVAAGCLQSLGRGRRTLRYLDRALGAVERMAEHGWISRAALHARLVELRVRVLLRRGDYQEAMALAERQLAAGLDGAASASLRQSLGLAASYLGNATVARAELERAAELYGQSGALPDRIRSLSYLAILEFRLGALDRAIELYRSAVELAEQSNLAPLLATSLLNLGTACQRRGDWGAALDHYDRALRLAHLLGRVTTEATLGVNLANLHVEIGSFDRGVARLDETERLAARAELSHLRGTLLVIRGEVELARGDLTRAKAHFEAARRLHLEREAPREAVEAEFHLADVALAAGELDDAALLCREAAAHADPLAAADLQAQSALLEARCLVAGGRPTEAHTPLGRALELCRESGQALLEAEVHAAYFAAERALEHAESAIEHRRAAQRILGRVAETLPPPLRAAFWAHPRRSELAPVGSAHFPPALSPTRHETPERTALLRFLEVNQRINSSLAVAQVLDYAMDAAIELTGAERGFVLLGRAATPADRAERYEVAVARNLDRARVGSEHYEFSKSIAERVLAGDGPIVTVDAQRDERFAQHGSVHAMALQSVACVPIRSPGGVLGALYLDNRFERGRFSARDIDLLMAFATQVAIALENARVHAELERRSEELRIEKRAVERLSRGQAREIERLQQEVVSRQQALELRYSYDQIVGRSAPMRALLARLDRIIDTPVTLLIEGESGTGKELVARAVHFHSSRRERPFVSVNCAALPEQLLESELFGHVRGAFTGASEDKQGLMVAASGGTLFLDEIGETPLGMQVKLLRALQERTVRPVGAMREVPIDVRVLAATNRDLQAEVARGAFREDLYYRLGVVVVQLPPLRERPEDVPALAQAFLERLAKRDGLPTPTISQPALRALLGYAWPGNVRQLENVLAKAYYLSGRGRIDVGDIELAAPRSSPRRATDRKHFEEEERRRILDALELNRWNVSTVARTLGIPRNTLYRKLERYRIGRPEGGAEGR